MMKKLLKSYGLQSIEDYQQMVLDSYINGQRKQAAEQFMAMPKRERIELLKYMIFEAAEHPLAGSIYFFNKIFGL